MLFTKFCAGLRARGERNLLSSWSRALWSSSFFGCGRRCCCCRCVLLCIVVRCCALLCLVQAEALEVGGGPFFSVCLFGLCFIFFLRTKTEPTPGGSAGVSLGGLVLPRSFGFTGRSGGKNVNKRVFLVAGEKILPQTGNDKDTQIKFLLSFETNGHKRLCGAMENQRMVINETWIYFCFHFIVPRKKKT